MINDEDLIEQQRNLAVETMDDSKWPGMSYEHGVVAALEWVMGESDVAPMDDE